MVYLVPAKVPLCWKWKDNSTRSAFTPWCWMEIIFDQASIRTWDFQKKTGKRISGVSARWQRYFPKVESLYSFHSSLHCVSSGLMQNQSLVEILTEKFMCTHPLMHAGAEMSKASTPERSRGRCNLYGSGICF